MLLNGSWSSVHGIPYPGKKKERRKTKSAPQLSQPHLFKAQRRLENVVFLVGKVWI